MSFADVPSVTASAHAIGPRTQPAALAVGNVVGRYQVRRLLGEGGMGRVYLARDMTLGRSVALKLVARTVTGGFLAEARTIARLNHPNIVQLYDFGEHAGAAFLALEYIDGQTLRERMETPVHLADAWRTLHAIADALVHAHTAGVWHCDLKPSNVMVGRDGRVRVVDFGIARTREEASGPRGGTPTWMAPEQFGPVLTERVDIWALGLLAAQLITPAATREDALANPEQLVAVSGVPASIRDLIVRSLSVTPELRPSADEWRRVLEALLGDRGELVDGDGPFPGLEAFGEQRARYFVGREREVDEFIERIRGDALVPIVGASGAGKSSFLHAGIVPRLRSREPWTVIALRPGADPIGALARRLVMFGEGDADELAQSLRATPTLLAARLATIARATSTRVLIAIDQLEEVFTQTASEAERAAFLAMLLHATDDPLDPVRVVMTVRDDFVGRLHGVRTLFVLQRLGASEFRRAVTTPLERCGYTIDAEIVDELVAELGDGAGLPLLQFACRILWDGRDATARRIRRESYDDIGKLGGALARHAERALAQLSPEQRALARPLLLRLVSRSVRRVVSRAELLRTLGEDSVVVLDRLLAARLLVQRVQTDVEGEPVLVEIAHESLLTAWPQLARWIDESREERRLLDDLDDAVAVWERRGERDDETWSVGDLAGTRRHAQQLGVELPARIEKFLAVGEARHARASRRRRFRLAIAAVGAAAIAITAAVILARYLAREELIRSNAGTIELHLKAFDIVEGVIVDANLRTLRDLEWTLFAAREDDPHEPGERIPADVVAVLSTTDGPTERIQQIRAPGGNVFLRFTNRGANGERCAPSWIRIQSFPGYSTSTAPHKLTIEVPTCQASRADMIDIPAGEFIYGGPGEPASAHYAEADYHEDEQTLHLDAFAIDRTETSNAMFAPFAKLASVTGYVAPVYSTEPKHANDGNDAYPVTEIEAHQAKAFCRYMGKRLPSDHQWVKAARGGLMLDGAPNPSPRRLYPWVGAARTECANQAGDADDYAWVAPVTAFECGASPYGVLNLAGNVQEWIDREGQVDAARDPLHAMRGGAADSPAELEHGTTVFRNHRDPRSFFYSIGFRCVLDVL